MRCERCGASNPADATWCGQCYAPVGEPATEDAPEPAGRQAPPAAAPAAGTGAAAEDPASADAGAGFRRRDGALEWACVTCGEYNPLDRRTCQVCGTAFAARFDEGAATTEPSSWGAALALSALLPGTGHYLAGRVGSGIARAVLFAVWLVGGLLLLISSGALAAFAALPLLLGALLVWAGTLLDVMALRAGGRELLSGRALLWLVVGVTVLLLLGAFGSAARLSR